MGKSAYGHLILKIKKFLETRRFIPRKIDRKQNSVAHCLANIDHSEGSIVCSSRRAPDSASSFVLTDCNIISEE